MRLIKTKTFCGLNGPYLTVHTLLNLFFLKRPVSICLHNFHRGDEDPDPHDHPFSFISFLLIGSYREYAEDNTYILRKRFSIAYRPATHRHRVQPTTDRCWTLCIKRKALREWGFWHHGTFIFWKDYLRSKGIEEFI